MRTVLVLISGAFPFQQGEEFLLQETEYYSPFERVFIIPIAARDFTSRKPVRSDIEVLPLSTVASINPVKKSISCMAHAVTKDVLSEVKCLLTSGRLSFGAMKQLLVENDKVRSVSKEVFELVSKIIEDYGAKSIVVYSYWMGIHAKMAVEIKERYPDIRIVTRCHGGDLYEYRYKTRYIPFRNVILNAEDCIYTISDDGKNYLEQTYPEVSTAITVSRLGTEQKFERVSITNTDGLSIVSCSYCIPLKRIHLIIEALSKITHATIYWTHIGDGSEFEKLRTLAAENLPGNIRYCFTGYIQNSEVQKLYSTGRYNLFINVSETEGIPVSIMEAMSYGIPVIATDVGGVSEMVEEGMNGFLLPRDFAPSLLRDRICSLLEMGEQEYYAMSANSHQMWEDKFNAKKNYAGFVSSLTAL